MLSNTPKTKVNLYDARFDFLTPTAPTTFYAVATIPRTGSSFLCEKLWRTGQLGAPYEYFNYQNLMIQMILRLGVNSLQDYVKRIFELRTSPNGFFGFKLFPEHFQFMRLAQILWRFPHLKFIYLVREDILAQAISYNRSMQTSQWSNYDIPQSEAKYDYNSLLSSLGKIEQSINFWGNYFRNNNIQPYRITYEQFISDPDSETENILNVFGLKYDKSITVDIPEFNKQKYGNNTDWKEQFYNDLKKNNPNIFNKYMKLFNS